MSKLSLSRAWDETKAIAARDGRLLGSVALAMVALPTALTTLITPNGMTQSNALWIDFIVILASLVALAGQLALIRLAIGPSTTVGAAIAHGIRRMPLYFLAVLMIAVVLVLAAIPFALVLAAMGMQVEQAPKEVSGPLLAAAVLYLALFLYVAVRMIMAAPAASAEEIGPIRIIRRSWSLTGGEFWRLLGFLLLFFIGAIILLMAIQSVVVLLVTVVLGPVDPMSASALVVALAEALANAAISTLFGVMLARIYVQLAGGGAAQTSVPSSGI
jgi:hypothetical protein